MSYTPLGVFVALTFIGLPFVVRTLEPVLRDLSADVEEASASLGASRLQTVLRVILPALGPAWLAGFAMALARGGGEVRPVLLTAGKRPLKSGEAQLGPAAQSEQ